MVIEIGAAKCSRFGDADSDETTEIIERPSGGQSVVYCSGKRNGRRSKIISSMIVNRVLEKTAESFRDSTAIKSVSDQIFRDYSGDTSGDLCMISADFESETIVVSRCTRYPVFYYRRGMLNVWNTPAEQVGSDKGLHPSITEIPIEPGTVIVMLSEGILKAGHSTGEEGDIVDLILNIAEESREATADYMAEFFLNRALGLDQDKPHDDMTAIVMKVDVETQFNNRRILMTCPVPKYQSIFD